MISVDQPTCFDSRLVVRFSSRDDGPMLARNLALHADHIVANRRQFCLASGTPYENVVYQVIEYGETESYNNLVDVTEFDTVKYKPGVKADGLFTMQPQVGLFLPVADCIATVVYDPMGPSLAVLHLGRHSTLSNLIELTLQRFLRAGASLKDLVVWMSPSAQRASYQLEWFTAKDDPSWQGFYDMKDGRYYVDLQGYNKVVFMRNGVREDNIHISQVDTMKNEHYFSHATGDRDRSALLAVLQ